VHRCQTGTPHAFLCCDVAIGSSNGGLNSGNGGTGPNLGLALLLNLSGRVLTVLQRVRVAGRWAEIAAAVHLTSPPPAHRRLPARALRPPTPSAASRGPPRYRFSGRDIRHGMVPVYWGQYSRIGQPRRSAVERLQSPRSNLRTDGHDVSETLRLLATTTNLLNNLLFYCWFVI
jgi:hypothetical protein